jgi:uncharacterized protein (DUF2141 family)
VKRSKYRGFVLIRFNHKTLSIKTMKARYNHRIIYYALLMLCFIVSSCARIVTPTGGEKDITPPIMVGSTPKLNATNFNGNRIEITFDEYITLDNATGKLIVSPPLKNKPTIGSKLKTLYIKDIDSLKENTTYIFDFGDAIVDFTEGNRLSHFSFAFSTGDNIDTFAYSGKLLNAYTLTNEPAKYVALYTTNNREDIRKNLPNYITKADSFGVFCFQNIKQGDYMVVAFDDMNQNMIYDLQNEGYAEKICKVDTSTKNQKDTLLFNIAEDSIQNIVSSKLLNPYEIQIITSLPTSDSLAVKFSTPLLSNNDFILTKTNNPNLLTSYQDTINILFKTPTSFDTIKAQITDINNFKESIDLYNKANKKHNNKEKTVFAFSFNNDTLPYYDKLRIFSPYILRDNNLKAKIITDTDTLPIVFKQDTNNPKSLCADYNLEKAKHYTLLIDSGQVLDIRGFKNEKMEKKFYLNSEDDYGSIVISIKDTSNTDNNLILTLIDAQNKQPIKTISTKANSKGIEFPNLKEGKYKLRLIIDSNSNNKWDKGNFDKNIKAEKVILYPNKISVRKGWQTQEEWLIN